MIDEKEFHVRANAERLFREWRKSFLADCAKGKPLSFVYVGDDETPNSSLVEDQVSFMESYLQHMLLDGTSEDNVRRIAKFLSIQTAHSDRQKMEIRFIGGSPLEVYIFVEELRDADIADIYGITEFDYMDVYLPQGGKWSKKSIKAFIKELEDDFAFDYGQGHVKLDYGRIGDSCLQVECEIDA
ncbi:MAG: hypothetical protein ACLPX5_12070 [Dissulfurispiraceae bacterium]